MTTIKTSRVIRVERPPLAIRSVRQEYYLSSSGDGPTGGEWTPTAPPWRNGWFLWTRSVTTFTDGSSATTAPACVSGAAGPAGATGPAYLLRGEWMAGETYKRGAEVIQYVIHQGYAYEPLKESVTGGDNPLADVIAGRGNWKSMGRYDVVATRVLLANFALIAGAVFWDNKLMSQYGTNDSGAESSDYTEYAEDAQGNETGTFHPNTIIDWVRGKLKTMTAEITGTINAVAGRIAGFRVNGLGLTNANDDGSFTNDAYIIFRNDPHRCFAGMGGNVMSAVTGVRAVARFENEDEGDQWGLGDNYAAVLSAKGAKGRNVALQINGGHVAGLAVRTLQATYSQTIDRNVVSVVCLNTSVITLTLPTMDLYDDGHVIKIKRLRPEAVVYVKPGAAYVTVNGVRTRKQSYIAYDDGKHTADPLPLLSVGDAMELVFHRDVNNGTQYGCWVQHKYPRDW
ncbi:MAG: hypothetical protein LBN29_11260 [Mediterranea sp.]|jgi:hypothetical protein|nr:hypothetical protein [Mediterranea sp.]